MNSMLVQGAFTLQAACTLEVSQQAALAAQVVGKLYCASLPLTECTSLNFLIAQPMMPAASRTKLETQSCTKMAASIASGIDMVCLISLKANRDTS